MLARTIIVVALLANCALAQSTAITYQGELKNNGQLAAGAHDLRFRLFNASSGGAAVGSQVCLDNVQLSAGRFSASLDFGAVFASTENRWLEVDVRPDTGLDCTNATGFTTLPRQFVAPAPRATAASVANALAAPDGAPANAVVVDNDGKVGVGMAAPAAPLHVFAPNTGATPGEGLRIQGSLSTPSNMAYASFVNGAGAAIGYVGDGSSGNNSIYVGAYVGDIGLVTSGGQVATATAGGSLGVGTASPAAKLDVRGDIRLGSAGEFFAIKSPANDRIIRGQVNANGTIDASRSTSGFTISHTVTGTYVINFTTPFTNPPVVIAQTMSTCCYCYLSQTQTTFATIFKQNYTTGAATDSPFQFVAIGQ